MSIGFFLYYIHLQFFSARHSHISSSFLIHVIIAFNRLVTLLHHHVNTHTHMHICRCCVCAYMYIYRGVYHDNEGETLVQLVFEERMNGITPDDLASSMCVRQLNRESEKQQKELEDKEGRRGEWMWERGCGKERKKSEHWTDTPPSIRTRLFVTQCLMKSSTLMVSCLWCPIVLIF